MGGAIYCGVPKVSRLEPDRGVAPQGEVAGELSRYEFVGMRRGLGKLWLAKDRDPW